MTNHLSKPSPGLIYSGEFFSNAHDNDPTHCRYCGEFCYCGKSYDKYTDYSQEELMHAETIIALKRFQRTHYRKASK